MPLLPLVPDITTYWVLHKQDIWLPAIEHIQKKHQLEGQLRRSPYGSHIVYRVGDAWIKLMAPPAPDMDFEIAGIETVESSGIEIPKILAKGTLEGWPYLIISHVTGRRIGDVWPELSLSAKLKLAPKLAHVTRQMQMCSPQPHVETRVSWNEFIKGQMSGIVAHHTRKKLDARWVAALPEFLARFSEKEFLCEQPVFLHADLTRDHFLIDDNDADPAVAAIIDFADCRVGHPEYDLPATAAFILKGQKEALSAYLEAFGVKDNGARMSEKLLAWTCLHFYSDLNNYCKDELITLPAGDFSALAREIFPL